MVFHLYFIVGDPNFADFTPFFWIRFPIFGHFASGLLQVDHNFALLHPCNMTIAGRLTCLQENERRIVHNIIYSLFTFFNLMNKLPSCYRLYNQRK